MLLAHTQGNTMRIAAPALPLRTARSSSMLLSPTTVRATRPAAAVRRGGVARSRGVAVPQRRNVSAAFRVAAVRVRVACSAVPPAADDAAPVSGAAAAASPAAAASDAAAATPAVAAVVAPAIAPPPLLLPPPTPLFGITAASLATSYTPLAALLAFVSFNLLVAPEVALTTLIPAKPLTPALLHLTRVWVRGGARA
jgi:hypothetical protein